jgi:hypothetical protein
VSSPMILCILLYLEILSADVQNAYLNASTKEKIYMARGRKDNR